MIVRFPSQTFFPQILHVHFSNVGIINNNCLKSLQFSNFMQGNLYTLLLLPLHAKPCKVSLLGFRIGKLLNGLEKEPIDYCL